MAVQWARRGAESRRPGRGGQGRAQVLTLVAHGDMFMPAMCEGKKPQHMSAGAILGRQEPALTTHNPQLLNSSSVNS